MDWGFGGGEGGRGKRKEERVLEHREEERGEQPKCLDYIGSCKLQGWGKGCQVGPEGCREELGARSALVREIRTLSQV